MCANSQTIRLTALIGVLALIIAHGRTVNSTALPAPPTPTVVSVRFQPRAVRGPTSLSGTVTLSEAVTSLGLGVPLVSNNPALGVPERVFVTAGQTTATFPAIVSAVATDTSVTITAGRDDAQKTTTLMVLAPVVTDLTISPVSVLGGHTVRATVTLNGPAPAQGFKVPITSNVPAKARVPSSVLVRSGEQSETFDITTVSVAGATSVTISAGASNPETANLTVRSPINPPEFSIISLALSQTSVEGGQQVTGTVQTSGPIPFADSLISVSSSDPGIAPVTALQLSGGGTNGTFNINTSASVTSPTTVTITATCLGQTVRAQLTVTKPSALHAISFPAQRIFGGLSTNLRLELDGPAPGNSASIRVQSPNAGLLRLFQEEVVIPAGLSFVLVPLMPNSPANPTQASVSADYKNQNRFVAVTVEPVSLDVCDSLPGTLPGGSTLNCTLTLTNNGMVAPDGGIQFAVQNFNPTLVSTPSTVTIPAGQNSAPLQVTTRQVTQNTTVNFRLSVQQRVFNRSFTLTPQ